MKFKSSGKEKLTRLIGIPVVGLLVPLLFWGNAKPLTLENYAIAAVVSLTFCFVLWQGNWYIVQVMRSRFPNISETPKRVAFQAITSIVYTVLASGLLHSLVAVVLLNEPFIFPSRHGNVSVSLILTLLISSVYESTYFFEQWKKTLLEGEKLKRENLQSQYEMLKSQVNPHFLFNSLNTLITIIPEDDQLAVEFTQKLSNVYRYLLQNKNK
ncbi:MAG: histidine kinase, partial [Hymenobacteraceae bacterium]|nr:histidine kinase [Hymenobacteraceae bacterium]MDX5395143.1 histidine kinase [Hymenobacteraceae bacterium]MDX5444334.1 histidine kinase [Hymenobacteraceae bacterium]MDX5511184.1 histidine kinase [Hymenobacteraceae bacterium]